MSLGKSILEIKFKEPIDTKGITKNQLRKELNLVYETFIGEENSKLNRQILLLKLKIYIKCLIKISKWDRKSLTVLETIKDELNKAMGEDNRHLYSVKEFEIIYEQLLNIGLIKEGD